MVATRKFSTLSTAARRDPVRARRIDAAKARAIEEHATYRLAELRQALGITQVELAEQEKLRTEELDGATKRAAALLDTVEP